MLQVHEATRERQIDVVEGERSNCRAGGRVGELEMTDVHVHKRPRVDADAEQRMVRGAKPEGVLRQLRGNLERCEAGRVGDAQAGNVHRVERKCRHVDGRAMKVVDGGRIQMRIRHGDRGAIDRVERQAGDAEATHRQRRVGGVDLIGNRIVEVQRQRAGIHRNGRCGDGRDAQVDVRDARNGDVADGERRQPERRKIETAQIVVVILGLGRPFGREPPFNAAPYRPANKPGGGRTGCAIRVGE